MTYDEFQTWLAFHKSCFTGIDAWLTKVVVGENAPTMKAILGRWYEVLKDVSLRDAKNATMKIYSGEALEPKGYDRHPAAIRLIAGKHRPRRDYNTLPKVVNGEYAYRCVACEDTGWRFVVHQESLIEARKGNFDYLYLACVVCPCRAGDPFRAQALTFDPMRDCEWPHGTTSEVVEHVRRFLAGEKPKPQAVPAHSRPRQQARRFSEFDEIGAMPEESVK